MTIAKITEQVRDQIFNKIIPMNDDVTRINCVQDCNFEWLTSMEEITGYNNTYPETPVEYIEEEWCPPCFDEEIENQIPCP